MQKGNVPGMSIALIKDGKTYWTQGYGDKELAIRNYEKSLELDPKNSNAVEMLKKLKN